MITERDDPTIIYVADTSRIACYLPHVNIIQVSFHLKNFPTLHDFAVQHELKHAKVNPMSKDIFIIDFKDRLKLYRDKTLYKELREYRKTDPNKPFSLKEHIFYGLYGMFGLFVTNWFQFIAIKHYFNKTNIVDTFFHPVLWSLPFLGLITFSVQQILMYGIAAKLPFESGNYSCVNVIFFCLLWLWSIYVFSKTGFVSAQRVYLAFCVIFAAYGIGEALFQIFWFDYLMQLYGAFWWLRGCMYTGFFVFNNVPLYIFLKDLVKESSVKWFFMLFLLHSLLWVGHRFVGGFSPNTVLLQYYGLRLLGVLTYAIPLGRLKR